MKTHDAPKKTSTDERAPKPDELDLADLEAFIESEELATLRAERDELKDRFMRALADAENARKRANATAARPSNTAPPAWPAICLPVYDNLRRALDAVPEELQAPGGCPDRRGRADPARTDQRDDQARRQADLARHRRPLIRNCIRRCSRRRCPAPRRPDHSGDDRRLLLHDRLLRPAQVGVSSNTQG